MRARVHVRVHVRVRDHEHDHDHARGCVHDASLPHWCGWQQLGPLADEDAHAQG